MAENHGGKIDNGVKCMVAKYMRDMSLVEDTDLSFEVFLATVKDDSYGPLAEMKVAELVILFVDAKNCNQENYGGGRNEEK